MGFIIGKVWLNGDWKEESFREYKEVTTVDNPEATLDVMLCEYTGKLVNITIESKNKIK